VQNDFVPSRRDWIWPLVVAAAIFAASSRSQVALPDVANIDKVGHFGLYGLLATLVVRLIRANRGGPWIALALTSFYGATDEFHQRFVPGRSCDVADWIADTAGAALAILLYSLWPWYRRTLNSSLGRKRRIENAAQVATIPGP